MAWKGLLDRFGDRLAVARDVAPVTLYEGNTPLIPVPRLADAIAPGAELYVKYEGLNPTGSFKDRGMCAAVTQAVSEGAKRVICASTGNTAASAAAYSARAGLGCVVLIPDGKIAMGKLAGAIAYGAKVVSIHGSFDDGLRLVREISADGSIALVNSVNPARLEGQKTAAWEVSEALGGAPDWLCLPVGNAGNISAYWMGFCEAGERPQLLGTQAAGAAPLVHGNPVPFPDTACTAIRIGNPARGDQALSAIRESNGHIDSATDDEIFELYRMVAQLEGVFCEPSSAAGLAGLRKAVAQGRLDPKGKRIVAVLTGHGLKDPDSAVAKATLPPAVEASMDALREAMA
jgi:threonine synthase